MVSIEEEFPEEAADEHDAEKQHRQNVDCP
jgi:hypothetical protein